MLVTAASRRRTDQRMCALAALLAPRFEVLRCEAEDLEAVIAKAGGSAAVFGAASGAVVALEAARTLPITRVAVYEAPLRRFDEAVGRLRDVAAPALVVDGENSEPELRRAARALWMVLPDVQRRTLEGQGSEWDPEVLAPALEVFFAASAVRGGVEA